MVDLLVGSGQRALWLTLESSGFGWHESQRGDLSQLLTLTEIAAAFFKAGPDHVRSFGVCHSATAVCHGFCAAMQGLQNLYFIFGLWECLGSFPMALVSSDIDQRTGLWLF
ncbi:hypothetical protein CBR_g4893 [Chara braunii]|uniref:Uncharacterized protein n=1 Tax=Chara braunii TaxID=69332 RepID=A0A388KJ25_CHABU|nr:hypothetical protein CBR_g4893 [Chara braunii]|eukprot:GBG70065.1 hypothetical protein CBR_g4893 [Chara braunii]